MQVLALENHQLKNPGTRGRPATLSSDTVHRDPPPAVPVRAIGHEALLVTAPQRQDTGMSFHDRTDKPPTRLVQTRSNRAAHGEVASRCLSLGSRRRRSPRILGVTKDTVYVWIADKAMPAHKVGRLWKFQATEVDAWVRSGGAGGEVTGGQLTRLEELQAGLRLSGCSRTRDHPGRASPRLRRGHRDLPGRRRRPGPAAALPRRRTVAVDRSPDQSLAVRRRPGRVSPCCRGPAYPDGRLATPWSRCPPAP